MKKVLVLALVVVLAGVSAAGYFFLGAKIANGETQLSLGQKRLEAGSRALEAGGDLLQAGEQKLSRGKHAYDEAEKNPFLVLGSEVLNGGKDFTNARDRIGSGGKKIAAGKATVSAGERRLDAGQARLSQGRQQLSMAEDARIACGLATIFLFVLLVALGLFWRRSLARSVR
ncbi:MAG: hypothetical protein ABI178_07880 [Rhodanobacter sp.]